MATIDAPPPTRRKWIIEKAHRRCSNYHCKGYKRAFTVKVDALTGEITGRCGECEKPIHKQAHKYKNRKTCSRCRDVVDVIVTVWHDGKHNWNDPCPACTREVSANNHIRTAHKLREQAGVIRAQRARRKAGTVSAPEEAP